MPLGFGRSVGQSVSQFSSDFNVFIAQKYFSAGCLLLSLTFTFDNETFLNFDVLLTVHLSIILVINQLNAQSIVL